MKEAEIRVRSGNLATELVPQLRGRVFHVTCRSNLESICTAGAILPNEAGKLQSTFGSSQISFFRLRGCVSVFDYRDITDEDLQTSLANCAPYQPFRSCSNELAVLFLCPEAYSQLEPWTSHRGTPTMVVPYAEAGFPGAISLSMVEEILHVTVEHTPSEVEMAHEAIMRKSQE